MGAFISWIKKFNDGSNPPKQSSSSLSGMISTLVPLLVITAIYLIVYLVFRRSQRRFYAPRSYLGSLRESHRSPKLPNGWFNWIQPFWKLPDAWALQHQSLDAYLFIRYLKVCAIISAVSLCITWPILFPVNATGGKGLSQLERVGYSNVDIESKPHYLYAHVFVGWAVYGFVMYMITRECLFYINLRQTFLLSPFYANRMSSRVVLFTNVPADYLDEGRLRAMYPGAVRKVWIAGETKELDELVENRDKTAMKLEGAHVKLIKAVNKARAKAAKKGGARPETEAQGDEENGDIAARWVPTKKRPSHRLGFLGLFGKKVDTINWGREELNESIPKTEAAQAEFAAGNYKKVGAAFIEFTTPAEAETAYQTVTHHQPLHMCPKVIGVRPEEVVWSNLGIPWWQKVIRRYAVILMIVVLIIFWAIPVGIVGLITQVDTLKTLPGLSFIGDIPKVILGVVSGLLPSVALAILMSLVPVFMRMFGKLCGLATLSQIELFTQNSYFCFQVIQVFIVATFTSSASTAVVQIANNPSQVFSLLSSALPTSANLYISYFMVQGITIASGVLTQVVGMVIFRILYKFLAGTPRAMYTKWTNLAGILWGSLLPVITNLVVILITYSIIQPVILFWSTIGLTLFYIAYRYNILFVSKTAVDTRGLIYPRALKQLFTGLYLGQIVMIGLFAVSKAIGPAVLMAIFLIFTILFQITLFSSLNPLLYGLSRSLAAEERALQERDSHAAAIASNEKGEHNGVDAVNNGVEGSNPAEASNGKSATDGVKSANEGAKSKGANMFVKWLQPWKHADYHTLRKLVPEDIDHSEFEMDPETEEKAYWPPCASAATPTLWIPEDSAGVSKQEVAETSKVIPITDQGATIDEKNKISWDEENCRPPIYEEKPTF